MGYEPNKVFSFTIVVDSSVIPLNLTGFNISIQDSIYKLCPELVLSSNDISGIGHESRLNILGQEITFSIDNSDSDIISFPMVNVLYETNKNETSNGLSGIFNFRFIHAAKFSDKRPTAYENLSPSNIFSTLLGIINKNAGRFSGSKMKQPIVTIETTEQAVSYPLIYNPGYDNEKFLNEILLPLSAKGGTNTTPYYAYINNENKAYFESLDTMLAKSPIKTLVFGDDLGNRENAAVLFTLNSFSQDYTKIESFIDTSFTWLNEMQEIKEQDISLLKTIKPIAIIKKDTSVTLESPESYDTIINADEEYGKVNFNKRKGLLIDKLCVLTIMDLSLSAGNTVNVETYLNTPDVNKEKSDNYSGKFLIEASEHFWDASKLMGFTRLILGRTSMNIRGRDMYQ